jgi:hypothetical protein
MNAVVESLVMVLALEQPPTIELVLSSVTLSAELEAPAKHRANGRGRAPRQSPTATTNGTTHPFSRSVNAALLARQRRRRRIDPRIHSVNRRVVAGSS